MFLFHCKVNYFLYWKNNILKGYIGLKYDSMETKLFPNSCEPDLWRMTLKHYILRWWILSSVSIWLEQHWMKALASINCKWYIHAVYTWWPHCDVIVMSSTALSFPLWYITLLLLFFSKLILNLGSNSEGQHQILMSPKA